MYAILEGAVKPVFPREWVTGRIYHVPLVEGVLIRVVQVSPSAPNSDATCHKSGPKRLKCDSRGQTIDLYA